MTNLTSRVSYFVPWRNHAGALRLMDLYAEIRRLRLSLHLALVTVDRYREHCGDGLPPSLFEEVHSVSPEHFTLTALCGMALNASGFDLIDLQYHQSGTSINARRRLWPAAAFVFGPMESQLRAAIIRASMGWRHLWRSWRTMLKLLWSTADKILYVLSADSVIVPFEAHRSVIAFFKREGEVFCVPTCLSASEVSITELIFHMQTSRYDIDYVGFVENVRAGLQGVMVGIAPVLSGAGMRGKIHQYAALGIPSLASPIAYEGLQYKHDESILVADGARDFAPAYISLLQNAHLRQKVWMRARELWLNQYQWPSQAEESVAASELGR